MNTLITARFSKKYLEQLHPFTSNIKFSGYGVTKKKLTVEEMKREIKDIELLISEYETINEEVISAARKLKVIACCRNEPQACVDINAATSRGIPVLFPPGRNAISVAEFTFGMMICLARNISHTDYLLKHTRELTGVEYQDKKGERIKITSEWSLDPKAPFNVHGGPELYKKKIGIIGYGNIGRQIARLAIGFNMQLLINDPYIDLDVLKGMNAKLVDLNSLMKESDFISINCKVTPQTTGLINREKIALMKPTAYLINTARASILDYEALYKALSEKRIAGAALDVFPKEPIEPDNPFLKLDNVVLTPHLAGAGFEIPEHHSKIIVDELLLLFTGKRPNYILNPKVLNQFSYKQMI